MNYTDITFILEFGIYDTLLLDRDGVINQYRPNDYVKRWDEFAFIPEFLEAIPQWSKLVKRIVIVTNQRGISKG
ncbi:MAG: phosphatase, partial [Paludibacteraceae bacterium]|nr:phosphatase [Paludibacteraceae bacterium]